MLLGYTICTETFGSGVKMNGIAVMREIHLLMVVRGKVPRAIMQKYCGAVLGASILMTAALPSASMLSAMPATITSVFVLSARLGGLYNPLLFSPLALFRFLKNSYYICTIDHTVTQVPLPKEDLGGADRLYIYFINTLSSLSKTI
jgi:hypothetical protein